MRIFPRLKTRPVRIKLNLFFAGLTFYPFVILTPWESSKTLPHEEIHINQQDGYWKWGGPFGLILWYFLYLLVLPIGWNPWRWKWEYEAYKKGSGYLDETIKRILRNPKGIYKLFWM